MKKTLLATVLAALAMTGVAHANETIVNSNNQLSFSAGASNLNYHELDNSGVTGGSYLDSEKGTQPAFKLDLTRQGSVLGVDNIYVNTQVEFARGNTDYTGYLQDAFGDLTPYDSRTKDTTVDVGLKVGKSFSFARVPNAQVTPYVGYSYESWIRDMSGQYGYKETYHHSTASVGVLGQYAFTSDLVGSTDFSYGRTFGAGLSADGIADFTLGNANVYSGGVGLDYAYSKAWHINGSYSIAKFDYGQSGVSDGYFEPNSRTIVQKFYVGVGYHF